MHRSLRRLFASVVLPHWSADLLLAIPRVVCGYLLCSSFGSDKFGMPWSPPDNNLGLFEVAFWFPNDVAAFGGIFAKFPDFFAWMAGFAEAVGGLFLMLGLCTRLFAFLILCTMLGVVFLQQWNAGIWMMLPGMGFGWVSLYALVLGSGRFGLDALVTSKLRERA